MNGAARIAELQRRWRDADVQAAGDELAGVLDELADEAASRDEEAGFVDQSLEVLLRRSRWRDADVQAGRRALDRLERCWREEREEASSCSR